jgi:fructose-1,6-bisphosphatase
LKTDTRALYTYFGDEVATLQARRTTVEMLTVQKKLEAFLETDPPISMTEVAHRLGWSTQSVRRNHPQLYQTIVRRFAEGNYPLTVGKR